MNKLLQITKQYPLWVCLLCGALTPLALAPFDFWPVAIINVALFAVVVQTQPAQKIFLLGWLFGIGLFGSGASWVYVSIHDYGYAPLPLAVFLTALFVVGLGGVFALPFYGYGKWFVKNPFGLAIAFPALWVLGEWSRTWLLTGFPWLFLGYGHIHSPLAGWFPVTGVFGASFIAVFAGCALAGFFLNRSINPLIFTLSFFVGGYALQKTMWTHVDYASPITVGIVQPNFALEDKWNPDKRTLIRETMQVMSEPLWRHDIILWPEAALSEFYHQAEDFLQPLDTRGKQTGTTLITGIPYLDPKSPDSMPAIYYNSITALGNGSGLYHKVRLVPFGEYVPLEKILRGLIRFLDLPMSSFSSGAEAQEKLSAGPYRVASFICYEIVYPDLVARNAQNAHFLVTISNDSWFGASLGPRQHLEMAQARALETQRFLIRSTNNGISAIVDTKGFIQRASGQFTQEILEGTIFPVSGQTPFMYFGSSPLIVLLILALLTLYTFDRTRRTTHHHAHNNI